MLAKKIWRRDAGTANTENDQRIWWLLSCTDSKDAQTRSAWVADRPTGAEKIFLWAQPYREHVQCLDPITYKKALSFHAS